MIKASVIMLVTFTVIGLILLLSNKLNSVEDQKKIQYRKYLWYFYGSFFILSSVVNLYEKYSIIFLIQLFIGILVITLNLMGKIETKIKNKKNSQHIVSFIM